MINMFRVWHTLERSGMDESGRSKRVFCFVDILLLSSFFIYFLCLDNAFMPFLITHRITGLNYYVGRIGDDDDKKTTNISWASCIR